MSGTPPPVDNNEKANEDVEIDLGPANDISEEKKQQLNDDLFFSTISDPEVPSEKVEQKKNLEDMDEIFKLNSSSITAATKEIKLNDDNEDDPFSLDDSKTNSVDTVTTKPSLDKQNFDKNDLTSTVNIDSSTKAQLPSVSNILSDNASAEEDDEERDKVIEISLSDPTKVGDGMGSYMVYKITTKTNIPVFKSKEFSTSRRFSDFLNLYEKLKEKHLQAGRILPPAPEKDMIGMAKVKMSKEDTTPNDFIVKRRAALERFLNRLAKHKSFKYDPDFRDFLEISEDLPKATNTSALSGAGVAKIFKNFTESVSKIAIKIEETDQWYEEKSRQVENLSVQYKKMHSMVEVLYGWRKDLASSTKEFSKSTAVLANSEEQISLSRALSQLGEIYEKIDQIYADQANADFFIFAELIKDYVCLFDNIKEIFFQRVKLYSNWQKAEETLRAKKEAKTKLEASNKLDKIPTIAAEIKDLEGKVEKCKDDFEKISATAKKEIKLFDLTRAKEFKNELTKYLQTLLNNQEQLVKIWDSYLPQVKAI